MKIDAGELPSLYGVLLAGGHSRRMGSDKAALAYDGAGQSQARKGLEMLAAVCERVFLSLRPEQEPPADVSSETACVRDAWTEIGPLGGILSAMDSKPDASWLVMACDLPLVMPETLAHLVSRRSPGQPFVAYRSSHDGLPEPLCAIYEPPARAILHRYREAEARCPRRILIEEQAVLLDPPCPDALDNANNPEDFEAIRERLRGEPDPASYTVLFFGSLATERGVREESIESRAANAAELWGEIKQRHRLTADRDHLRVAVNHDFADWETPLRGNEIIAFLPPMAGG